MNLPTLPGLGSAVGSVVRFARVLAFVAATGMGVGVVAVGDPAGRTPAARDGVPAGMVPIPAGIYSPLFRLPDEAREVAVPTFFMATAPVTNGEFLEFVRQNPRWRRSQVKRLFADAGYLHHWNGDLDLGPDRDRVASQPVVRISWFAAKAYSDWMGYRLPTTAEWELAAAAGFSRADGTNDIEFQQAIARWYGTPSPSVLPSVRSGRPNVHGVHDLHGLVWEWTGDFNTALVTGDARGDTGIERQLFCGAGSLGAGDRSNFPAFMRSGFRSSLKAAYTIHNLGFRCVADPAIAPSPTSSPP